ncbi:MAG: S8 family serine peptidase, partial [Deltaproteobacteria bacterium]|nr:S8 family serine peptidase [Deltaproteobacteria bacterium]
DWNFDHEILPIDETGEYMFDPAMVLWIKENPKWPGKDIPENIHHGTAVVGIIAGQGNGGDGGISGIASKTAMRVASISGTGGMGNLKLYGDGDGYTIGLIFTIEVQRKGATTTSSGCTIGDGIASPTITGCVPMEASKYLFDVIQTTTSVGAIIVEGAGNGSVDLDTDAAEPKDVEFSNFSDPANDSGAIMVGASMGASRQKAAWSNCGSRVDVFGWGAGVVTSGYGDKYCEEGANGKACTDPDNPTKYTGQFGGTSAATAQIAGIAALVQSYMRQLVFEAGYNGKVVYLDSKQMRTILKNSGQPAVYNQTPNDPNPNCNIGVQPDMAKAIEETNKFLNAGNILKVVPLNGNSDPNGGPGGGVVAGIRYDMDGDKRAELISFSRDHKWYIDLSSTKQGAASGEQLANCEQSADGYCAWDVILSLPQAGEGSPEPNAMLFPVVHDYNSDGKADLALYDSINGKWYIKYTTSSLILSLSKDEPIEWDRIINYTADPAWKAYSRPVPGDYDGDNWLDTALQTPDGHWLIDYGGYEEVYGGDILDGITISVVDGKATVTLVNPIYYEKYDKLGQFDKDVKYLTDEQLAQAPGWAWLPTFGHVGGAACIAYRSPDGIGNDGDVYELCDENFEPFDYDFPSIFGSNEDILIAEDFGNFGIPSELSLKSPDGIWKISDWDVFFDVSLPDGYGDINCRPSPADYDSDEKIDRAVQCGTTWKIAYSSDGVNFREVELNDALDPVPAYVYPGGIKYEDTVDLYNYYKAELGGTKDSTIFDAPPPIGPYFAQCVKYWAPNAAYCWDK